MRGMSTLGSLKGLPTRILLCKGQCLDVQQVIDEHLHGWVDSIGSAFSKSIMFTACCSFEIVPDYAV